MKLVELNENLVLKNAKPRCFHCGLDCAFGALHFDQRDFCCLGCKSVYKLLKEQGMGDFYKYSSFPGTKLAENSSVDRFQYLDDANLQQQLFQFQHDQKVCILVKVPAIHCASCIWLLENLHRFHEGVLKTQVNFLSKVVKIHFDLSEIKFSELVRLLSQIGYEPDLKLNPKTEDGYFSTHKKLLMQTGVAGFCFGNIMMLSFPEYLSGDLPDKYKWFFSAASFILVLPVLFYSGMDWFKSAFLSLKNRMVSFDVPIAAGLSFLFIQSLIEIFYFHRLGYLDSLSGFIFFMLIARIFQSKIFYAYDFEKRVSDFLPLYAICLSETGEKSVPVQNIKKGDVVYLRNGEVLPFTGKVLSEEANVDYSFITGESETCRVLKDSSVKVGGRVVGKPLTLEVEQPCTVELLKELWSDVDNKSKKKSTSMIERFSPYFVVGVFFIAISNLVFQLFLGYEWSYALLTTSCIFIITCPCAIGISAPLLNGLIVRKLAGIGFFIKDPSVIEKFLNIDHIVFDKTGTITKGERKLEVVWESLKEEEKYLIGSLARGSMHPVCLSIKNWVKDKNPFQVLNYCEEVGNGVSGDILGKKVRIGNLGWLQRKGTLISHEYEEFYTGVSLDGRLLGVYCFREEKREGLDYLFKRIKGLFKLHILSGDRKESVERIAANLPDMVDYKGELSPDEKAGYIEQLRSRGQKVLMIGDGLNDIGALGESDIGAVVISDATQYNPACDVIIKDDQLKRMDLLFRFAKVFKKLLKLNILIGLSFNTLGIVVTVAGYLTPLWVAILMPLSSVSVLIFSVIGLKYFWWKWVKGDLAWK